MTTETVEQLAEATDWRPIEPGQCALCGYKSSRPKTLDEFCEYWRMTRQKFYQLRGRGQTPATIKVGGQYFISREAEDEWIRRNTSQSVT